MAKNLAGVDYGKDSNPNLSIVLILLNLTMCSNPPLAALIEPVDYKTLICEVSVHRGYSCATVTGNLVQKIGQASIGKRHTSSLEGNVYPF